MQILSFTPKLLRPRHFSSFLLLLLALFAGLGSAQTAFAQTIDDDAVTFATQPTGVPSTNPNFKGKAFDAPYATYIPLGNTSSPVAPPPSLGSYDLSGTSVLNLMGADMAVSPPAGRNPAVATTQTAFRVFLTSFTAAQIAVVPFTQVAMTLKGPLPSFPADNLFQKSDSPNNLLAGLTSGGNYTIQIQFQTYDATGTQIQGDVSTYYTATFDVKVPVITPPGGTTTWVGGNTSDPNPGLPGGPNDWNTAANWSNGIPTALSDAIIPAPARPQPPILNVSNQNYSVRNLTIQGSGVTFRGLVRVTTATLKIYGDIINGGNGILATTDAPGNGTSSSSSYIVFAGGNQTIDQGRFANAIVQNNTVTADASGNPIITLGIAPVIKSLYNTLSIPGSLTFAPNVNAVLRTTSFDAFGNAQIDQGGTIVVDLANSGSVSGETTTASVLGLLKSSRLVTIGQKNFFGNIGIDITIFGSSDGSLSQEGFITRSTGLAFSPVTTGTGPRPQSIKRVFANSFTGLQSGFNADVVFHYLNSTTTTNGRYNELGSNVDGRLELFRTASGSTFTRLGGLNTVDPGGPDSYPGNAGIVEQKGLSSINTLTLADFTANPLPLPVVLSAFDVKQVGTESVVSWSTASEKNSLGFYVEVSANGSDYRSLGFVASADGNSNSRQSYRFVDSESGKTGIRYYRLHQVDTDGRHAFSPVKSLDFGTGSTTAVSNLQTYPNPFSSDITVSVSGASVGSGVIRLMDLTGRTLRSQQVTLEGSAATFSINDLGGLTPGMYIVQLALPSGKLQQFKVQKQ